MHFRRRENAILTSLAVLIAMVVLPRSARNATARWQRKVARCTFAVVILIFPEWQTVAAVVFKLPRWACDVARTSFRKFGCDAQHALSPRRGCYFDDARGCDGYDGAATFGPQRGASFTVVACDMPFYPSEDAIRATRAVTLPMHKPPRSVSNVSVQSQNLRALGVK